MVKGAWVTLATNDSYSLGALVLAHSLKQVGTQKELAILVTPGVTNSMRARLSEVFNSVKEVNILDSRDKANLRLLQRPELGITFTKLHCWQLTEYEKCVFLDADTLVLQNCDELFEREELSAAPDVGWPDCFNSGVFVYRPSEATYNNLIQFALDKGSFDGGDQGLLNLYFSDWARKDISKHLPFIYNVCSTAFYSYLPAFKQFGKDVKIIHFIGNAKPWLQYFDTESKRVRPSRDLGHLEPILQRWWNIFCSMIHPNLTPDMSGLAGAFAKLTLGQQRTPEQEALEDSLRRQNWEQGNIDYLGKDSFDNIWSKICETLAKGPQENEGENSTQLKSDELVLATPQQESSSILKEDVVPALQEAAVQDSSIEIQEKASSDPIPLPPSPGIVETPKMPIPQIPETVSTPEVSATTEENLLEEKSENKISSVPTEATIPTETLESKIVEQVPPVEECAKSGNATEIKSAAEETSKVIEKVATETISSQPATEEISKPQDVPVSTESTTSDKEPTLLSQNVTSVEQDKIPSTPIMPAPITPKPEDISKEKTPPASQKLSSADPTLPLVQQAPLPTQVASTAESVPPQVAVCPRKDAPSEETLLKETPSSPVSQVPVSEQTVLKDTASPPLPAEQGSISEIKSCTLIKASAPEEPPKPEQIAPEKGVVESLGEATEKACSVDNAPSTIQAAVQQVPLLPQPATTTPVPIAAQEKASTPLPLDPAPQSPSTATPRSTDASSEPLPPITPPPRKNGGNKKQNKSKK